jgi:concanavalin A-like lectin/glucanase superfamily protein
MKFEKIILFLIIVLLFIPISLSGTNYIKTLDGNNQSFGNSNNLFIDNTNTRIGIGTVNPTQTLTIVGDLNVTGDISGNQSMNNYVYNGSSWVPMLSKTDGVQKIFINNSEQGYWGVSSSNYYYNDGNVGIGTSNPSHELNVVGDANVTGDFILGEKITFTLGEIIDNIVDGFIRITGNLNVTENLTVSGNIVSRGNGVGIDTLTNVNTSLNLTIDHNDKLVTLNSSATADASFTLPSVDSSNDGEIYRILNDASYVLTITPNDTSAVWNSGSGYGIDLPDKGTMVSLRYDFTRTKWDILQKTGGKVLIEGLVLMEPMHTLTMQEEGLTGSLTLDKTGNHVGAFSGDVNIYRTRPPEVKFLPACFQFPGDDESIDYVDSTDWDIFGDQIGHKTVAFWVRHTTSSGVDTYMSMTKTGENRFYIQRNGNGIVFLLYEGNNVIDSSGGGGDVNNTDWHHIAIVINRTVISTYLDGDQIHYTTLDTPFDIVDTLYLGHDGASGYADIRMQDLHISYNNPYNANPNSGKTDNFTLPAAPFVGVMN